MNKPVLSPDFTVNDIRVLRDYNSIWHRNMALEQICDESRSAVNEYLAQIAKRRVGVGLKTEMDEGMNQRKTLQGA